jgi:hypothetical protein
MLSILISLIILLVIFAILWYIVNLIPVPANLAWVVKVVFALFFLIALISLLTGGWAFPFGHPLLR